MRATVVSVALISLLLAQAAIAADWTRVPSTGTDAHFYDRSKVILGVDDVVYWRKVVFAKPVRVQNGTARTAIYRERIHCRDHTLRALTWQLQSEDGQILETAPASDTEAAPIVPETVGDRFQDVMCGLLDARKRRDAEIIREESQLDSRRQELDALKAEIQRLEATVLRLRSEAAAVVPPPVNPGDAPGR
ncbi:MAG: hypothetical protein KIT73_19465 [Burkholderiales bacterium]|nr:hypothetical protein [Burkholderiales bacterium]